MNMKLYPGHLVRVRHWPEIAATLDKDGALEGLPFMPEMMPFCGQEFRVFRRLEKTCVEGYGARVIPSTVLLEGLRCNGSGHDGCQRSCALLWKEAWLEPGTVKPVPAPQPQAEPAIGLKTKSSDTNYFCQSTELARASQYLFPISIKRCTAEYCAKNVGWRKGLQFLWTPFVVKVKTKLLGLSSVQPVGQSNQTPTEKLELQPGEMVQVKTPEEIALTLDTRGRNRGLSFTPQMLPFCGHTYKVRSRVERVILEETAQAKQLQNTVILEDVTCDGHTILGGCSRDIHHLWREIWLRRVAKPAEAKVNLPDSLAKPETAKCDSGKAPVRVITEKGLAQAAGSLAPAGLTAISLADYTRGYVDAGWRRYRGSGDTWWLQYEQGGMMRLPIFAVNEPTAAELRAMHWSRFAPVVNYLLEPAPQRQPDCFLYVCADQKYYLEGLEHRVRTNVKRGLREVEICFMSAEELQRDGLQGYLDTERRHGHNEVKPEDFQQYAAMAHLPGNRYLGAFKDGVLAAYMGIIEVDDWVDIRSRYSVDDSLPLRPNDALIFAVLRHYLVERKFRLVTAGTSSIDPTANTPGLHRFKVKMGFRAVPVRRHFSFHPLLRPLVNRSGLGFVTRMGGRFPHSRALKMIRLILEHTFQDTGAFLRQLEPEGQTEAVQAAEGGACPLKQS